MIFLVISLTPDGDTIWVYKYNGPANGGDQATSIVYSTDGNIYAAGSSYGIGTSSDFTVISLTPAGDTNWVYRTNKTYGDYARAIAYGADGNIYAAGYLWGGGGADIAVISLTPAGDTNWIYQYNGPGNGYDELYSIVYGSDGNIYAAGSSYGSGTNNDITTFSLTPAGDTNWVYRYTGSIFSDNAFSIAYGTNGRIYTAGNSYGGGGNLDLTVISLGSIIAIKENDFMGRENRFASTIFTGPLRLPKGKTYKILDITGRVVMPEEMKPGIYFIEIDRQVVQKIVKIK